MSMASSMAGPFIRAGFKLWRSWGRAPGWYYQAVDKWGGLAATREPLVVTLFNGRQMLCDLRDHVERQVYFIGLYEPIEVFVLMRLLRPGMTMIDGGANVGQFTIMASDAVSPSGAVHSFEPVPSTFSKLRRNVEINRLQNVHTNQVALWYERATLRLGLARNNLDNAGAFGVDIVDAVSEVDTKATRLDEYAEAHQIPTIDFIKLDVEGAELQAMQGMSRVLERDHPTLLVEICRKTATRLGYDVQEIWKLLVDDMGYRGWAVGLWTESAGALSDLRSVTQQNVLFYHDGRMGPPEMPSDLKSILCWARGSSADASAVAAGSRTV